MANESVKEIVEKLGSLSLEDASAGVSQSEEAAKESEQPGKGDSEAKESEQMPGKGNSQTEKPRRMSNKGGAKAGEETGAVPDPARNSVGGEPPQGAGNHGGEHNKTLGQQHVVQAPPGVSSSNSRLDQGGGEDSNPGNKEMQNKEKEMNEDKGNETRKEEMDKVQPGARPLKGVPSDSTVLSGSAPGQVQGHGPLILTPRQWPLAHVYMDFASLPMTDRGGKEFVGAVIIVDAASRVCQFTAVEDKKAATAVACLKKWINHWGMPVMVHCDNGSHFTGGDFTQFLADMNIAQDPGTPYHSRGRGIVERLVKKLKNGAQRLIPQGKLDSWPVFIDELERMVNRMPHKALGGEAPFDYLIRGHRQRGERFVVKEGRVFDNWTFSLPGVQPTPQREEDLALMLDSLRAIADSCSEVTSLKEAMYSESEPFSRKGWGVGPEICGSTRKFAGTHVPGTI